MRTAAWIVVAAISLSLPVQAQPVDRASIADAEMRRCRNAALGSPQAMGILAAAGADLDRFCSCAANMFATSLSPDQLANAAQWLAVGKVAPPLREKVSLSLQYCSLRLSLTLP